MTNDEATKLLDDALVVLAEHFDVVIILASRDAQENDRLTQLVQRGRGNWFAQRGMLREVLDRDQALGIALEVAHATRKEL